MKANYKLDTEIGAGSYGKVYKATLNKKPVAVKLLHESLFHESIIDKFREECELLQRLNHKNVVRLIQFDISCSSRPALITELMDCDLEKYIKVQTKKIPFPEVVSIMLDVAEGLRYLHYECNPAIIHRDLASKNILLTKKRQAKIADLGLAKFFLRSERMFASPVPGTQFYAAPETFPTYPTFSSNNVEYNEKIDIFSFGIVLMETIIGNRSNLESIFDTTGRRIPENERRKDDIHQMGDHRLKRLVLLCIKDNSDDRPTAEEVVAWLQKSMMSVFRWRRAKQEIRSNQPPILKIVTLGKSSTGKTCIIKRFIDNYYEGNERSTIGIDCCFKSISVYGTEFRLSVCDTAGQERFSSLAPIYLRDTDGVLLVFDVTNKHSFHVSIPAMVDLIKSQYDMSDISVILVGNKVDAKKHRKVSLEMAEGLAENLGMPYIETSAKTGQNVQEVFEEITKLIYIKSDLRSVTNHKDVNDTPIRLHGGHKKEPTKKWWKLCFCD